jgi:hypothetical protein
VRGDETLAQLADPANPAHEFIAGLQPPWRLSAESHASGVPGKITSPGWRGMMGDSLSTSVAAGKIIRDARPFCIVSPRAEVRVRLPEAELRRVSGHLEHTLGDVLAHRQSHHVRPSLCRGGTVGWRRPLDVDCQFAIE